MYSKFPKYRSLIQQCDRRYLWQSVYSYDVQFRAKCGAKKSFDFDNMDVTLYTTLLDGTAIRGGGKQYARCRSYDHFVKNSPFPRNIRWRRWRKRNLNSAEPRQKINGSIRTSRGVIISRTGDASMRDAHTHMCADGVAAPSHSINALVNVDAIKSPLNLGAWVKGLANHPDYQFVDYIFDGIQHGVRIGYSDKRKYHEHSNCGLQLIHITRLSTQVFRRMSQRGGSWVPGRI